MLDRDETPSEPAPEELAAEYLALREGGEPANLSDFLARLPREESKSELRELVANVERANRVLPRSPVPGSLFRNRYEILRQIGEGGMGRVYLAHDKELGRNVALKVISSLGRDSADRAQLLLKESRLLAALQHPNIVAVHDSGLEGELAWLVMDFVDGRSLADVVERMQKEVERTKSGRIGPRDGALWSRAVDKAQSPGRTTLIDHRDWYRTCARIVCEITRTIEAAHGQGVLHRDLKPANVMLQAGGHPVVLDFGLGGSAGVPVGDVTQGLFGSVPYLAPEQIQNERVGLDPRTDVYQLGLILYELLTLKRAFAGPAMAQVLERVKNGWFDRPRTQNPAIPRELEAICMLALERVPERRYATARALREDLEAYLSGTRMPLAMRSDRARALLRSTRAVSKRHPVLVGLAAVVAVGLGIWGATRPAPLPEIDAFKVVQEPGEGPPYVELANMSEVRPRDLLGVRVCSSRPVFVYTFSLFKTLRGEERIAAAEMVPLSMSGKKRDFDGEYGETVQACEHEDRASCPRLVCTEVDADNRVEGLVAVVVPERRPDLEAWMKWMDPEGGGTPHDLREASDQFERMATSVSKGGSVTAVRFTDDERARILESMRSTVESNALQRIFGDARLVSLVLPVKTDG